MTRTLTAVAIAVALAAGLAAEQQPAPAASPFDSLKFRHIGPASMSGRVDDLAVFESNPAIFYVAGATSGLWKTTNHGTTFTQVFDSATTSTIGDVAIAPNDANLVWVGTGEANNRQSSSWGDGLYKSGDGGLTWQHAGLADSKAIARIIVDPVDYSTVYVAAAGNLWGAGGERGVYKTADGGQTWTRALHVDDDTGATDLVMDPSNNKVLYAAMYQRRRAAWGFNGGGPGSGIYKTSDAGRTWTKLTRGIPEGPLGRIGLDLYRRNPNVVYATIEHQRESGVYRSDDAGATWAKLSATNPRPMYFSQIRVDPMSDHRIYVLGVQLHVSDDGGKTFRNDGASRIHVDHHAMWINPRDSNMVMIGNDGGMSISYDRSRTWVWMPNLPFAQFYRVTYDMQRPYHVCGGLQDNNTWCAPSDVRNEHGIANDDWYIIGGGDGFQAQMDPADPRILYAESQDGRMNRVDRVTNERKAIRPEAPEGEPPYRWNWDTPMRISAHNPSTIFVAANRLFTSSDRGHSWKPISPDLTTNTDRETLSLMGVVAKDFTIARHDGVQSYGNLVQFSESPRKPGIYYTGSDDGVVSVSRDDGANWANVTARVPGLPKNTYVSRLEASRFEDGTVYAAFDGHRTNDFGTYVFASTDFGNTWRSIAGDLPKGQVVRTIAEDLKNPEVLYLGTESGLFVTIDRGRRWTRIRGNFPTVPVYEITLHPRENDMIVATHGRGVWILDDLAPFQQFAKAQQTDAFLFEPEAVAQRRPSGDRMKGFEGDRQFLGANPARGASVSFHLKSAAKDVTLTVRDNAGAVVRQLAGDATKDARHAGVNTVVWDLRVRPLAPMRNQQGGGGGGGFGGGGNNGPLVPPGAYRVTLSVDGREAQSVNVGVAGDPEIQITDADRRTHFDTVMALHVLQGTMNEAADLVTDMDRQLTTVNDTLEGQANVPGSLKSAIGDLRKSVDALKPRLGVGGAGGFRFNPANVRGRVGQLKGAIMGSTSLPTETQTRMVGETRTASTKLVDDVNGAVAKFAGLYKELATSGLYPAPLKPIGKIPTSN
ncbi:MAG: VPS10 domain-containing protein [Vicinamibacterales bacterium]